MKRTLYLSMVCLLSAFSAVGQTGLRGLNPIEKQKLQLPELPASQSRVTLLRSSENVDYTQGVFILNEDWFGHNNSTINFMTSSGDFAYRIFQTANPGKELGVHLSLVLFLEIICLLLLNSQRMVEPVLKEVA